MDGKLDYKVVFEVQSHKPSFSELGVLFTSAESASSRQACFFARTAATSIISSIQYLSVPEEATFSLHQQVYAIVTTQCQVKRTTVFEHSD